MEFFETDSVVSIVILLANLLIAFFGNIWTVQQSEKHYVVTTFFAVIIYIAKISTRDNINHFLSSRFFNPKNSLFYASMPISVEIGRSISEKI